MKSIILSIGLNAVVAICSLWMLLISLLYLWCAWSGLSPELLSKQPLDEIWLMCWAVDAISLQVYSVINTTYVNAKRVADLLKILSTKCKKRNIPLYLLDNARYQHCSFVKAWATALDIELVFLPPYSPNLNLIERLWKYIKKDILGNQYFEPRILSQQAIVHTMNDLNHCTICKADWANILTLKFWSKFAHFLQGEV